jgi:hypothetical protein
MEVHFAGSMNVRSNVYFQIISQIFMEKCEVNKNRKKNAIFTTVRSALI